MKTCTKCKQEQDTSEFTKDRSRKDDLNLWCKSCTRANSRRICAENQKHYKEKHLAYNQANPGILAAASRRYYWNNREHCLIAAKITRQKEDKEQARARWNRRHAREANAEGSHTTEEWEKVLTEANGECLVCRTVENMTRDHIIPLSRGGTDYIENIQPLCASCNASKGNRHSTDYRSH